ncbi:bifunctional 23S rRNA (guanine(2069)-N(7))-methyltransferase RlmK/23S rRNA (guanine(2445)-N(2))-methyltransferase RlmL [Alginatibacterium sediminis]|uniref:Ribosomal RNA large subunit methyltransferase K/L n=1 Tax=Alginatibacterium sediminis TaxID=2164068 RepID=A0A420EGW9_9ALTE|nr:bifunctional 23S rRNA (guanine(2069)-N(7))-methyltransferase RlmK/23S rRNA (guanine(2445)-N(2))-methyltransferase RlmL [Alginatibacterium sediminis]RKF19917.1 bifunctional 23S rRNA (guanine(2069)-N(7))-methyltransferase RlmK/23S rRNA (guanine(2445)-N(2))-methyltransferase RlmL [Alginatibacterium sediminis]
MQQFFASCAMGLEQLIDEELQQLDAQTIKMGVGGLRFEGSLETAYQMCLWSRYSSRVLMTLADTRFDSSDSLYAVANDIVWEDYFEINQTFAVYCSGTNRIINNSQFAALRVKDAIVDRFARLQGDRPSVSKESPDVRIMVHISREKVMISLDLCGEVLSKRGYRTEQGDAPLKENLAAALVKRANWTEKRLVDPMCGSGTILIEAAMMAADIAPGLNRYFHLEALGNFDADIWRTVQEQALERREKGLESCDRQLIGYDIDRRMITIANANIERAGLSKLISVHRQDAVLIDNAPKEKGLIISNPPYGERLGEVTSLIGLFLGLGAVIKNHFSGWRVALLSSTPELFDYLRMRSHKQYKFMNGPLDCVFKLYEVGEQETVHQHQYAEDFVNRLRKNKKRLAKWLKREEITCYRLYDADLPEYNVAVDIYDDYMVVQEYRAPAIIDPNKARRRLMDLLTGLIQSEFVDSDKLIFKQRSQQKGKDQYQRKSENEERMVVSEFGAKFYIDLVSYLDTGLFLDHRNMRHYLQQNSKDKRVLNLFAYTGAASVHAAIGGASQVTTIDMSNTYLDWAKDNFRLNDLNISKHAFMRADCLQWLSQPVSQQYDLIFLDPPTFSNSKKMSQVFDVQNDHVDLIRKSVARLRPGGLLIFSNNKRQFKMDTDGLAELSLSIENVSSKSLSPDFERKQNIHNCWFIRKS